MSGKKKPGGSRRRAMQQASDEAQSQGNFSMSNVTPLRGDSSGGSEQRDLRGAIHLILQNKQLTQTKLAQLSGAGVSALNQWLQGKYGGDVEKLESTLSRWLENWYEQQRQNQQLPVAPHWVDTPSSQKMISALGYAQLAADVTVIYGGAGLGKTKTNQRYQETAPNVFIATMTPATSSVVPALEEVAEAVGIKDMSGGAARFQRAIIRKLTGTGGLLIIDEAQHLSVQALDAMRALHDATEIGLALVGNEQVYARMTGGNRAAYLDRLFSRIGKRVRLTRPTKPDVDALVDAWGIDTKSCRAALQDIAAQPGGLRGLTKVLRLASMIAAGAGRAVCCDDIRAAWKDLGGVQ